MRSENKICTLCKIDKTVKEYPKNSRYPSKLDIYCKKCCRKKCKEYSLKNKDKIALKDRTRYGIKREEIIQKIKKYYLKNKKRLIEKAGILRKEKMKTDINFKLAVNIRGRLGKAVRYNYKSGSAVKELGCSISEFKAYIEKLFESEMNWSNWGRGPAKTSWHLDHIKPLSLFDLSKLDELKKACHYSNMRPMWAEDNIKKGDKYE